MSLTLSCAFATSMATPDHVVIAESLGYERAWLYDSPALYPDVWVQLARAAERTSTIGLGPGVLIPTLRHPMTTAAAIATLVELAGVERVAVAVGTGFTGRFTLGQRPLPWARVAEYVKALRGLLSGETVLWEGGKMRMMHPAGFGAPRPIDVPILLGAAGPKGIATAHEVGDGVFIAGAQCVPGFAWAQTTGRTDPMSALEQELVAKHGEAERARIFPEKHQQEAMGITDFTLSTMTRWVRSDYGRAHSLHPFRHGHFLGSGSGAMVMKEAGLDGRGQFEAIRTFVSARNLQRS